MPTLRTDDGIEIAYAVRGDGPLSLLFMHGWAGSGAFFDEALGHLDLTGLRAITYDLRGHGSSDKVETGYTLDRFAEDAFAVADAVCADRFVAIGYSMSGKFAQYLSCARPERILGQILVSGCTVSQVPLDAATQRDWINRAGDRERIRELEVMFVRQPVPLEVMDRFLDDAAKVPRVALDETLNMCVQTSFAERLLMGNPPTLVVGGLHDPIFTPDVLRQSVLALLSGARLALLDCGHDVPIERPLEFAALIEAFVAGLNPSEQG